MNMERENAWNGYETEELKKVDALNQEYRFGIWRVCPRRGTL